MKKIPVLFALVIIALGLLSFSSSINGVIDLTSKGIPVSLDAPEGAIIEKGIGDGLEMDGSTLSVLEVNKGTFSLEVSMDSEEMYQEAEEYIQFFKEMVEDENFETYILEPTNQSTQSF